MAIGAAPFVLALAYVIVIMSYIIVPVFIAIIIITVTYGGVLVWMENKDDTKTP